MAAEDSTIHHEESEWEAQKDNFTKYYKTEKKTLRDAARCMVEFHNFSATPRQWERKVKVWGLEKYTSRQERLRQIESQGRSIHEVARAGRRPKTYDAGLLHPEHSAGDDRNVRRFARREMNRSGSRSRSRSRSNSFGNRSRSASPLPDPQYLSEEVLGEEMFDLDFSPVLESGSLHTASDAGPIQVPAVHTDHSSFGAQAHVLQIHNTMTGEMSDDLILSLPEQSVAQEMMHSNEALAYGQYQFADLDRRYSLEVTQPQQSDMDRTTLFPALDTSFESQSNFISPQNESMDDISPTVSMPQNSTWISQSPYGSQDTAATAGFPSGSLSRSHNYPPTPFPETDPMPEFQANTKALHTPTITVPELVFPPSSPSPSSFNLPVSDLNVSNNNDQYVFADFHASVSRYSQAVIDAVHSHAVSSDDRSDVLNRLANDLMLQKAAFVQDMTMHLNNFVLTQQRAAQSIKEQSKNLRRLWHIEKMTLESENATMKRIVQQIPGAAEQMAHQHRFSLPGNYTFPTKPHAFTTS